MNIYSNTMANNRKLETVNSRISIIIRDYFRKLVIVATAMYNGLS